MRSFYRVFATFCLVSLVATPSVRGNVELPAIFGSNMVLQQKQPNRVWGWADAGDRITVSLAGQNKEATAGADGRWQVTLDPMDVGGPHRMVVKGSSALMFDNVMSKLPNTGEAVILNLGEANDIHPKNKQDVAKRLARWALARDYGFRELVHRSPLYSSMEKSHGSLVVNFDHVGGGLDTLDVNRPQGFTIAGEDQVFRRAQAQILGRGRGRSQIKVWSDLLSDPVAVRYAWADNPVCNVQNQEGLPLTPFRTDDWPGVTAGKHSR